MRRCSVSRLGCVDYEAAWELQNQLVQERSQKKASDRLLLLEHPHTYTLGSAGHEAYILFSEAEREARGITVFQIDRGGDVTYHGPGQLVGYPILKLPRSDQRLKLDVRGYLRNLEAVIIHTLADFEITGHRIDGLTGVWVETPQGPEKVCAIGVKINVKAVTKHGFALNINTDMDYFSGIVPCGIHDKGVTSMAQLLGRSLNISEVTERVISHFGSVFNYEMQIESPRIAS